MLQHLFVFSLYSKFINIMKTHFGELLLSLISLKSDTLQFYQNKIERL